MIVFENIRKIKIPNVIDGYASNISQFYDKLIKPQFKNEDTIRKIHYSLIEYINSKNPTLFIRLYGSFPRNHYKLLRRGFVTRYGDNTKVVFCDNTFTMLPTGMKLANFAYSSSDLQKLFDQKKLVVGFGQTSKEKEFCYYDPRGALRVDLNSKGWYQAHIKPTGYGYKDLDLKSLFPNPTRDEYNKENKIRDLDFYLSQNQLKILKAHFLRLIHPFNSFLVPKKTHLNYDGKNIGEENELINFVRKQIKNTFPVEYDEFDKLSIEFDIDETASQISNIQWYEISKNAPKQHKNNYSTKNGLSRVKIGRFVRDNIDSIIDYCNKTDELSNLLSKEYSKKKFNINYPFFKKVSKDAQKQDRYWKIPYYVIQENYYAVTSEWFEASIPLFKAYLKEIAGGIE